MQRQADERSDRWVAQYEEAFEPVRPELAPAGVRLNRQDQLSAEEHTFTVGAAEFVG
jgi:hypothetical protein